MFQVDVDYLNHFEFKGSLVMHNKYIGEASYLDDKLTIILDVLLNVNQMKMLMKFFTRNNPTYSNSVVTIKQRNNEKYNYEGVY